MLKIETVIPHIPSTNKSVTAAFFTELFEFKIKSNSEHFTELKNNQYTIGLLKTDKLDNEQSIYMKVSKIDELWTKLKNKIVLLKHRELFTQPYGMKEFHVIIPETSTLLMVGESTHD